MSAYDIMPYSSSQGGTAFARRYIAGSTTFRVGEPVMLVADGKIDECTTAGNTNPTFQEFLGIAAGPGQTYNINTDTDFAVNDSVPVWVPRADSLFITSNFTSGGAAFDDVVPAQADIGNLIGLIWWSDVWGVDLTADTDGEIGRIVDVLNENKESVMKPWGTPRTVTLQSAGGMYYVVFELISSLQSAEPPAPI